MFFSLGVMAFIFIYVTCADEQQAQKIAMRLLQKRLIACANIFPIKSLYRWEGKIQDGKEFVTILKTRDDKYDVVKEEIERLHSYNVPCITKIKVEPNSSYATWLEGELS